MDRSTSVVKQKVLAVFLYDFKNAAIIVTLIPYYQKKNLLICEKYYLEPGI